jgi:phosphatidylserine/phosphatidylglycerophosphate/cardiolipin synthase-like enzyme
MTEAFSKLSDTDLRSLIAALRSKRIAAPFSELQVTRIVAGNLGKAVAEGLIQFESLGFNAEQLAAVLELLLLDRQATHADNPYIDLVTSGPEAPGITNRDTSVVVRELFAHAEKSVLVVGYAVYQGQRVFESLARRMEELPDLDVQFFLNIPRPDHDKTPSEILVTRFAQRFRDSQWPSGCRLPEVYYDPRSVADDEPVRSSLHAKCVVVDSEHVFVSSANFTEAGQQRNIEVGLSIRSKWLAQRLIQHFKLLQEHRLTERAF